MLLPVSKLKETLIDTCAGSEGAVKTLAAVEKEHIVNVLRAAEGNKSQAAIVRSSGLTSGAGGFDLLSPLLRYQSPGIRCFPG